MADFTPGQFAATEDQQFQERDRLKQLQAIVDKIDAALLDANDPNATKEMVDFLKQRGFVIKKPLAEGIVNSKDWIGPFIELRQYLARQIKGVIVIGKRDGISSADKQSYLSGRMR